MDVQDLSRIKWIEWIYRMDLGIWIDLFKHKEMKFFFGVLIFFLAVFLLAMRKKDSMEPFKWVLGDWKMERKSGVLTESWKEVNDSSYEGKSYITSKAGENKMLEEMQLIYRQKKYHFISAVPGQNKELPVSFLINTISSGHFLAENPEHDFPRRISYQFMKPDSLHAWIDGGPANADQRVDFYFSRKK
jgi:Domain of unknown function (DUF6265)